MSDIFIFLSVIKFVLDVKLISSRLCAGGFCYCFISHIILTILSENGKVLRPKMEKYLDHIQLINLSITSNHINK